MTARMNPDVKALWLAALRSGQYKRGTGALHRFGGCMCPYGVLCALAADQGIVDAVLDEDHWLYDGSSALPPRQVLAWAGLRDAFPALRYEGKPGSITDLNDDETKDVDFLRMADLIEEQL